MFDATQIGTAVQLVNTILRAFAVEVRLLTRVKLDRAAFFIVCDETVKRYRFVLAKHSLGLVGSWFERNVRMGHRKFFRMVVEVKCFKEESKLWDSRMTIERFRS